MIIQRNPNATIAIGALVDGSRWDAFAISAGRSPVIINTFQAWGNGASMQTFPLATVQVISARGAVPLLTWEPYDQANAESANQPAYALSAILSGNYDSYITAWATAAASYGHPIWLRFAQEMTGDFWAWGCAPVNPNSNTPNQFIQVWRKIHDIFRNAGASNVVWIWCPNLRGDQPSRNATLPSCYPGDGYVDWTAFDAYNYGTDKIGGAGWVSSRFILDQTYAELAALSGKPIMLAEWGCGQNGGDKAAWLASALSDMANHRYPKLRAAVYFHRDMSAQSGQSDWRITSSEAARAAYASGVRASQVLAGAPWTPPDAVPTAAVLPEPLAAYQCDGNVDDSSGNEHHATFVGGTWTETGITAPRVTLPVLPTTGLITAMCAVQTPASGANLTTPISLMFSGGAFIEWSWKDNPGRVDVTVSNGTTTATNGGRKESTVPMPVSAWVVSGFTYDCATGDGVAYTLWDTYWYVWEFTGPVFATTPVLTGGYIGQNHSQAAGWAGQVGYVSIWDRLLPPDEGSPGFPGVSPTFSR